MTCREVDWDYWPNSAKELDADHPTTARQLTPDELIYWIDWRNEGGLQAVRAQRQRPAGVVADVSTTMICTHVLSRSIAGALSALDRP